MGTVGSVWEERGSLEGSPPNGLVSERFGGLKAFPSFALYRPLRFTYFVGETFLQAGTTALIYTQTPLRRFMHYANPIVDYPKTT